MNDLETTSSAMQKETRQALEVAISLPDITQAVEWIIKDALRADHVDVEGVAKPYILMIVRR